MKIRGASMSRSQRLRRVVATVLMATCIATTWGQQPAAPPAQQKINLDIPSQPVAGALTALGQQSGLTIMLAAAAKSDVVSPAVVGEYTPDEALRRILDASGLKADYLDSKTVSVRTARSNSNAAGTTPESEQPKSEVSPARVRQKAQGSEPQGHRAADANSGSEPQTKNDSLPDENRGMAEILIRGSRTMNVD